MPTTSLGFFLSIYSLSSSSQPHHASPARTPAVRQAPLRFPPGLAHAPQFSNLNAAWGTFCINPKAVALVPTKYNDLARLVCRQV